MSETEIDQPQKRKVSWLLLLGIIVFPPIFVWFTFRRGHTAKSRVFAMIWLVVAFFLTLVMTAYEKSQHYSSEGVNYSLSMVVRLNGGECPVERPVAVTIINDTGRTFDAYSWNISVKARGHSTELGEGVPHSSDVILEPEHEASFCQEIPPLSDNSYPLEDLVFDPGYVVGTPY